MNRWWKALVAVAVATLGTAGVATGPVAAATIVHTGTIDPTTNPTDSYTVLLEAGGPVTITVDCTPGAPTLDTLFLVYAPNGAYLTGNDDGGPLSCGGWQSSLTSFTAPTSGLHTVTVTYAAVSSGQYTLTMTGDGVIDTPVAPAITSVDTVTVDVGVAFTHTFTAAGSPTPNLSTAATSLPAGVTLSGNTLSGTPDEPGTYSVDVTASNGVGDPVTQVFTLEVLAAPVTTPPPTTDVPPTTETPPTTDVTPSSAPPPSTDTSTTLIPGAESPVTEPVPTTEVCVAPPTAAPTTLAAGGAGSGTLPATGAGSVGPLLAAGVALVIGGFGAVVIGRRRPGLFVVVALVAPAGGVIGVTAVGEAARPTAVEPCPPASSLVETVAPTTIAVETTVAPETTSADTTVAPETTNSPSTTATPTTEAPATTEAPEPTLPEPTEPPPVQLR